jgi:pathogenesis-related protein 1
MYKLLIVFILLAQQVTAQTHIINTGSNIKDKDAEIILAHHNTIRDEKKLPALSWSPSLAAYAQNWADHLAKNNNCTIKHRAFSGENGMVYGENIFWGSSAEVYAPAEASYSWYSEKKQYSYRKINTAKWYGTGHYTQMMWKTTREMGVGVAICPNGAIIVVANYFPAGNVVGEYPY